MSWIESNWIVAVLLLAYTGLLARNAILGRRATHGMADYYVGGRNMGGVALGFSFFATFCSTNGFVGLSGQSYTFGAPWLLYMPLFVAAALLSWRFVAPRFRHLTGAFDSVTIPDFVGSRYGSPAARTFVAVMVVFASIMYMTAIYKGMGNVLQVFLDIPYTAGIALVFVITMAYTAVGGFKSVVRTDVFQGVIMLCAAVLVFFRVTERAGGVSTLSDLAASPQGSTLFAWDTELPFAVLLGIMSAGAIKLLVEPRQLSRFYALKDESAIRRGQITSVLGLAAFFTLLLPVGLYARLIDLGPVTDTDLVVPLLLASGAFSPVESALVSVAIVAAAMSSLDSVLLVVASVCHRDLGARLVPATESRPILATRIYLVLVALVTALVALNPPGGIVQITTISGSVYGVCFTPVMVFGLHWSRGNGAAVIGSSSLGLITLVVWDVVGLADSLHQLFPALAVSLLSYWLIALAQPRSSHALVEAEFPTGGSAAAMDRPTQQN